MAVALPELSSPRPPARIGHYAREAFRYPIIPVAVLVIVLIIPALAADLACSLRSGERLLDEPLRGAVGATLVRHRRYRAGYTQSGHARRPHIAVGGRRGHTDIGIDWHLFRYFVRLLRRVGRQPDDAPGGHLPVPAHHRGGNRSGRHGGAQHRDTDRHTGVEPMVSLCSAGSRRSADHPGAGLHLPGPGGWSVQLPDHASLHLPQHLQHHSGSRHVAGGFRHRAGGDAELPGRRASPGPRRPGASWWPTGGPS